MIGFLVVDKEAGWTSHDVVARCRRVLSERRIGHSGTLDPGATGVLVLGVGRATRLLRYVSGVDKEYRGQVVLGATTSTLDEDGEVTARFDMRGVTVEQVQAAARTLTGEIDQRVPMVSAVKVGGERLHRLARSGVEVETPIRRVRVDRFEVAPGLDARLLSSTSRALRGPTSAALAADLGAALGGGAYLRRLRRTRVGPFTSADARTLSDIEAACATGDRSILRPPLDALGFARVVLSDDAARGRPRTSARGRFDRHGRGRSGGPALLERGPAGGVRDTRPATSWRGRRSCSARKGSESGGLTSIRWRWWAPTTACPGRGAQR